MALPRHALAASGLAKVTQIRASDDYGPGARDDQWRIGRCLCCVDVFICVYCMSVHNAGTLHQLQRRLDPCTCALLSLCSSSLLAASLVATSPPPPFSPAPSSTGPRALQRLLSLVGLPPCWHASLSHPRQVAVPARRGHQRHRAQPLAPRWGIHLIIRAKSSKHSFCMFELYMVIL
jgi:hypothetical protein